MSNLPSRIKAASKRIVIGAASRAIEAQSLAAFLMGRVFFHIRGRAKSAGTDVPATAGSILVIRLDEVGDLVMLSPFLRALRRHFTQAHITLVVNPAIVNLVELCPYVNEVLTFDPRGSQAKRFFYLPLRAFRFASQFLWKRKYDLALLPRRDADCAYATFLGFWSKARQRVGYSENATPYKSLVNRGFDRLLTHVLHDRGVQHEVESNLAVLKSLGIAAAHEDQPEVWLNDADRARCRDLLEAAGGGSDEVLIGICPSGGHSVLKQWPLEHFATLGRRLQEKYQARIVVIGGPGEEALAQSLVDCLQPGAVNLAGRTTLRQMAGIAEICRVYIGNDVGPTHIAAAAGTPVVAVFGSSCPHRFQPRGKSALVWRELPCSPCRQSGHTLHRCDICIFDRPRCLTEILPEEVEGQVARFFEPGK